MENIASKKSAAMGVGTFGAVGTVAIANVSSAVGTSAAARAAGGMRTIGSANADGEASAADSVNAVGNVSVASTGETILAHGRTLSCDTRATGLNNNMLVLGPSGSGKTRHVLKPNLLQMNASYLVIDTKGLLAREMGPTLARHGYDVQVVNFSDLSCDDQLPEGMSFGYNPLDHIRRDAQGRPNQQDILSVCNTICAVENLDDPFWDHAAANYLAACIAYTLEKLPRKEQTLRSVVRLVESVPSGETELLIDNLAQQNPQSFAVNIWRRTKVTAGAPKMHSSILGILAEKLMCLTFDAAYRLYEAPRQVDFAAMGHTKVALFVTVDDIDRSLDPLTSLFVTQALHGLMHEADRCPQGRLPVPVRLFLDDFANLTIPDFTDAIGVIRSREIWCTLLLQTHSQLVQRYGEASAATIVGNCDTQLVLGFQDDDTARRFAPKADRLPSSLLFSPLDRAWLFVRGSRGEQVERYRLEEHPCYGELCESEGCEAGFCAGTAPALEPSFEPVGCAI